MDIEERFLRHVAIDLESGCWMWTAKTWQGYGRFSVSWGATRRDMMAADTLGRPLDSFSTLTKAEAGVLIEAAESAPDAPTLMEVE